MHPVERQHHARWPFFDLARETYAICQAKDLVALLVRRALARLGHDTRKFDAHDGL